MTTMDKQLTTHPAPVAELVADAGLDERRGLVILETFGPLFVEAEKIIRDAAQISVTDEGQEAQIETAALLAKDLKDTRCAVESARVELKADSLKLGKGIDNVARMIRLRIEPAEAAMKNAANFAENARLKREAALALKRSELLRPFGTDCSFYNLGAMDEGRFTTLLEAERSGFEAREQEKRAAAEAEKRAREEREAEAARLREENERLRKEQKAKDEVDAEERRKLAAVARFATEQKEAAQRLLDKANEINREHETEAARAKEQMEKQRAAHQAAPDSEKLRALAGQLRALVVPNMATPRGLTAGKRVAQELVDLAGWIEELAGAL